MALLLGSTNIAFAEESGGFVGIGIGYGDAKFIANKTDGNKTATDTIKSNGISYGFVGGYKQFFNDYLGLRYYANVNLTHAKFNMSDSAIKAILLNYGVNVVFLGNFVVTEIADFGGFIGLGIGGNSWIGKDIEIQATEGEKVKYTSFDVALNVGLRTNIAKYHGIELAFRVPFLNTLYLDNRINADAREKNELGQTFSILARYTFSF